MKIGIFGGDTADRTIDDVVADAKAAEASGFSSYSLPQIFGLDAMSVLAVRRTRSAAHRALDRRCPDVLAPAGDDGAASLDRAGNERRAVRARHRTVASDRHRTDVGTLVREAAPAHARVPLDPAAAAQRPRRRVLGRDDVDAGKPRRHRRAGAARAHRRARAEDARTRRHGRRWHGDVDDGAEHARDLHRADDHGGGRTGGPVRAAYLR